MNTTAILTGAAGFLTGVGGTVWFIWWALNRRPPHPFR